MSRSTGIPEQDRLRNHLRNPAVIHPLSVSKPMANEEQREGQLVRAHRNHSSEGLGSEAFVLSICDAGHPSAPTSLSSRQTSVSAALGRDCQVLLSAVWGSDSDLGSIVVKHQPEIYSRKNHGKPPAIPVVCSCGFSPERAGKAS